MLADGRLDSRELASLEGQRHSAGIDSVEAARIHRSVATDLTRAIFDDGIVTDEELRSVGHVLATLSVRWEDLPTDLVNRVHVATSIINIQKGHLPILPPGTTPFNLTAGETAHLVVPGDVFEERTHRETMGRSSGYSVRIARGVTYRVGSSRGISVPVTTMVPVDSGVLGITDRRLLFAGGRQQLNAPWAKVGHVVPMSDGIVIGLTSRKKTFTLRYRDQQQSDLVAAVISHHLR